MLKKGLLFLFLLGFLGQAFSQAYTPKRDRFGKELQTNITQYLSADEQQFVKKELLPFLLNTSILSENVFTDMVNTCNEMVGKRMSHYPNVYNYVYVTYLLHTDEKNKSNYAAWNTSFKGLLGAKNTKSALSFMDFSANFWQSGILGGRNNVTWLYRGGKIQMKSDKKGPFVELSDGDLICELDNKRQGDSKKIIDSMVVFQSKGTFYPLEEEYIGKGGKLTWEKVEMPSKDLYAELVSAYTISTKRSELKVDTVSLKSPLFKQMVKGTLSDRAYNINREADKSFPRFQSFEKSLFIKEFAPGVDYKGGFKYEGADFVGTSVGGVPATLTIYKQNQIVFGRVYADIVTNSPIKLFANNAAVAIYLGEKDSIVQQDLTFDFFKARNTFEFTRPKSGGGLAPFTNSYHQLDMYVPKLIWVKDSEDLILTYGMEIGKAERIATLESRNYYTEKLFAEFQGISNQNPLVQLYNYCYKYDRFELKMGDFATALNRTPEQSQHIFYLLRNQRFISYNSQTKLITVEDKTKRFIDASQGKIDYDNIVFVSDLRIGQMPSNYTEEDIRRSEQLQQMSQLIKERNSKRRNISTFGKINLESLDLAVNAIEKVTLSDRRYTFVVPDDDFLTITKNRNFFFSGWVRSGKLEINVREGDYDYIKNSINLKHTEETVLSVTPLKPEDGKNFIFLNSFISDAKGVLYIDEPNNRSGRNKDITNYPKLDVRNRARVFYNDVSIQRAAYDSTNFYFVMDPFLMDSLVNFNDANLTFDGELISAGIFPKFREKIKVMPDYSLGFSRQAPKGGFQFYETDAMYNNKIVLSNNGLQGSGVIDFVNSKSESAQFTFLPDSTIGYAKFTNLPSEKGIQFPDANGKKVYISYNPRKSYLNAYTLDDPIILFDSVKYTGQLVVRKDGMTGNGLVSLPDANLSSKVFKFTRWKALANVSDFDIKNKNEEAGESSISFKTENVNSDLDFKTRKGVFKSNKGSTKTFFPLNNFYCLIDQFVWYMEQQNIDLESSHEGVNLTAGVDLVTPNFFSENPEQDSLSFKVPKAKFSLIEKIIHCKDIDFLDIADARIFPDKGELDILVKGDIKALENAKIVANFITKYYTFDQANVKIQARRKFEGNARYQYVNIQNDSLPINIHRIYADTAFRTIALGNIKEDEGFQLSPYFDYYGKISIETSNPMINFDGATRILHDCSAFERSWMAFNSPIDPKNIQIPVSSTMKSLEGNQVMAGLVWHDSNEPEDIRVYPTFLSKLLAPEDNNGIIMAASGFLQYDVNSKEYQISNQEKLVNRNEKGNYLSLHTQTCSLKGDGEIKLGMDYGKTEVSTYGLINYDNNTGETNMNITAYFKYPMMDENSLEKWATKISKDVNLKPLDWNTSTIEQALKEVKDNKTADAIKNEFIQKKDVRRIPKEFEEGIVVTGIRLKSYRDLNVNGFKTDVNNASLVNVYKKTVFKQISFKALFEKVYSQQTTGDSHQFSIDVPGAGYLFFNFETKRRRGKVTDETLLINTNEEDIKSSIETKKDSQTKKGSFFYMLDMNDLNYNDFLRRF